MTKGQNTSRKRSGSARILPLFAPGDGEAGMTPGESDAALLEQITEGDHSAFATLVRRHALRFFRVAYRFVQVKTDAEDIVQDAFLKIWERPYMWQPGRNTAFTTWFYRIVVNLCLDHGKKKRPFALVDDHWVEDERQRQDEVLLEQEKEQLLAKQIALLPERQRAALNLCFYEGLSNQEAAEVMGVHLKALQALLMRAKTTLKERLNFMLEG